MGGALLAHVMANIVNVGQRDWVHKCTITKSKGNNQASTSFLEELSIH